MLKLLPFGIVILVVIVFSLFVIFLKPSETIINSTQTRRPAASDAVKSEAELSNADRIRELEFAVSEVTRQLNQIKAEEENTGLVTGVSSKSSGTFDTNLKLASLEDSVKTLQQQIAALKTPAPSGTATPAPAAKHPLYIPLGTYATSNDRNYYGLSVYEVTLDSANYTGHTSVQLEINMKLIEAVGTAYARVYNVTDGVVASSEVTTTSTSDGWYTSSGFSLASGKKTYRLQIKSSEGYQVVIQNARLKVNF